ncbi:MAG: glycosyltransferase [Chloroflexota bacterium]|nr:glycosyltransferase [Chloroflexota bacterium]
MTSEKSNVESSLDTSTVYRPDKNREVWLLRILVVVGFFALGYYFNWWWGFPGRIASPWVVLGLLLGVLYTIPQILGTWFLYLVANRHPRLPQPLDDLTVDVFVTACDEPYPLIQRTLKAACTMRGNHRTWLLDDGYDPVLARLAEQVGARYLTRRDRNDAKAGNINAALARTDGDIVVIFDADHAPLPDFLEHTLGFFRDPKVGFVHVMLTFCNGHESWVAAAAAEASLDFYNPTSLGMARVGGATMMGSNALIRRTALDSIGGYQPGLAEDLATSIALHATGWRSAYVAEPLAPGLAPSSLAAWFTQQLKWARGVFEVLLTDYPRLFTQLTWGQRLSYAVRMTYYWAGPVIGIHIFLTLALLFFGDDMSRWHFQEYLIHFFPLAMLIVLIRAVALRVWRHPSLSTGLLGGAVFLVYATWPIYTLGWLLALFRVPLAFRLTPKDRTSTLKPVWLLPQAMVSLTLYSGALYSILIGKTRFTVLLLCWALAQSVPHLVLLWRWALELLQKPTVLRPYTDNN